MAQLAIVVRVVADLFMWIVFASVLLSYFLPPDHPVREALGRIVEPFLTPIRNMLPRAGMFDFSPTILIVLVYLLSRFIVSILISL